MRLYTDIGRDGSDGMGQRFCSLVQEQSLQFESSHSGSKASSSSEEITGAASPSKPGVILPTAPSATILKPSR